MDTPTESFDDLKSAMQNYGIDIKKYQADGSLIIVKGEDLYKNAGNPDL
jgi:hypothetical protein